MSFLEEILNYWLVKSEPDVFSIDDLKKKKVDSWDGVRNYQARNYMQEMKKGDMVFFYHSNASPKGIAGMTKVVKEAYPDHTSWDPKSKYYDAKSSKENPRWFMVDVAFVEKFNRVVSLEELKKNVKLKDLSVVKRGRLSVHPVEKKYVDIIMKMVGE